MMLVPFCQGDWKTSRPVVGGRCAFRAWLAVQKGAVACCVVGRRESQCVLKLRLSRNTLADCYVRSSQVLQVVEESVGKCFRVFLSSLFVAVYVLFPLLGVVAGCEGLVVLVCFFFCWDCLGRTLFVLGAGCSVCCSQLCWWRPVGSNFARFVLLFRL